METSTVTSELLEPHLNADGYKMAESSDTHRAPTHCDFISFHDDGPAMVGCSNYTERYWLGAATVGDTLDDVKTEMSLERSGSTGAKDTAKRATILLQSCITAGCFLTDPNKVLLTEDSGSISLWMKSDGGEWGSLWGKQLEAEQHDGAIIAIECLQPDKLYITVGDDANIMIWDALDLICMKTFRFNESIIYDVSVEPDSLSVFATASMDGAISLWDINCDKRAKVVGRGGSSARCVRWLDERRLVTGDEAGMLKILDVRSERVPLACARLPAPLHRLDVQHSTKRVAVCCDAPAVLVYGCSSEGTLTRLYESRAAHVDLARGVAWDRTAATPDLLHSASWDGRVLPHLIPRTDLK